LFWLLIGSLEAQNIEVRDPAFSTTQESGYISFYIIFFGGRGSQHSYRHDEQLI